MSENDTQKTTHKKIDDSRLSIQYMVWKHLQLTGHEVDINDFKITVDKAKLDSHDILWKNIYDEINKVD